MTTDPHRVSDHAVLRSIAVTLRQQVLPAVDDPWTRASVIQLAALAQMLHDRPPDPGEERAHELAALLEALGAPGPTAPGAGEPWSYDAALGACSSALAGWDLDDPRRARLRARLVEYLDADLATNLPLLAAFRGQLPDA